MAEPDPLNSLLQRWSMPRKSTLVMCLIAGIPAIIAWRYPGVLAPFLLAVVLAYLLNPVVRAIDSMLRLIPRKLARWMGVDPDATRAVAVSIFFTWLVAVLALFGFPLVVALIGNLFSLAESFSASSPREYQEMILRVMGEYKARLAAIPGLPGEIEKFTKEPEQIGMIANSLNYVATFAARQARNMASILLSLFSAGASLAIVPLLLFYSMADWDRLARAIHDLVPRDYHPWYEEFSDRVERTFGGYLRAQIMICLIFGTAVTIGFQLIGIPYALLLGILAGAANFVPYLGVIVSIIPSVAIVFLTWGFTTYALWILAALLILLLILQFVDGFILQPKIMAGNVGLHPLAILFALAMGQELGGIYGLLLAVPAAALLKVLSVDVQRLLYDPESGTPAPSE